MSVTSALGRLRQKDHELEASVNFNPSWSRFFNWWSLIEEADYVVE